MPIKNRFGQLHKDIIEWRHDFHQHPELLYEVHRTASRVADLLRDFGCNKVIEAVGQTGVVGVITGAVSSSGKVVGLRADMDALPIMEEANVDYASKTPGKMHACGHDGHTAMLLGAAKYLCETRNFNGEAVVVFQPAEEGGAGAKAMIDEGLMERFKIQEIYGMHNMPGRAVGQFAICAGPILASADKFKVQITGKGGHAAIPHEAIDTTLIAAQILVNLNLIVSRSVDPLKRVVITAGTFKTDSNAANVIAHRVIMEGSVRCLDEDMRGLAEKRVKEVVEGIALAHGAKVNLVYERGYPVTVNHDVFTQYAIEVAKGISNDVVENADPIMPSEDFSYMLEARPGAFIFLGNGDSAMCHHPKYIFDDNAIPFGSSWYAGIIEARMPNVKFEN